MTSIFNAANWNGTEAIFILTIFLQAGRPGTEMKFSSQRALECAATAARAAGRLMRSQKAAPKKINEQSQHDIKLELDVRCQKLIEKICCAHSRNPPSWARKAWRAGPTRVALGGGSDRRHRQLHLRRAARLRFHRLAAAIGGRGISTVAGVVYDPFCDELWTAARGGPARLNGKVIHASRRRKLAEAIVAIGFSKTEESLNENLPVFNALVRRVRKIRMMGAAALRSLTWPAGGSTLTSNPASRSGTSRPGD
jgi:myo-inositol-1(or 4)-monophosphatase